jgi:hypothetical protein
MSAEDAIIEQPRPPTMSAEKRRPISVTIIAWFLIIGGGLTLIKMPLMSSNPDVQKVLEAMTPGLSMAMAVAMGMVDAVIKMAAGIAILKAKNWGRMLYLGYIPIISAITWIHYGFYPLYIIGILFYLVILFFLTRPAASSFFRGKVFRYSYLS